MEILQHQRNHHSKEGLRSSAYSEKVADLFYFFIILNNWRIYAGT